MKRVALIRRTSLVAGGRLTRRGRPAVRDETRDVLLSRSGGRCEMQLHGCWREGVDPHHRITQKSGGRRGAARVAHDRPSNLVLACRPCHQWVTCRPGEAYEVGLSLREGCDPSAEPVQLLVYDVLPVWLDDEGGWRRFEARPATGICAGQTTEPACYHEDIEL